MDARKYLSSQSALDFGFVRVHSVSMCVCVRVCLFHHPTPTPPPSTPPFFESISIFLFDCFFLFLFIPRNGSSHTCLFSHSRFGFYNLAIQPNPKLLPPTRRRRRRRSSIISFHRYRLRLFSLPPPPPPPQPPPPKRNPLSFSRPRVCVCVCVCVAM